MTLKKVMYIYIYIYIFIYITISIYLYILDNELNLLLYSVYETAYKSFCHLSQLFPIYFIASCHAASLFA